jgi:hypothetical protein
MIQLRFDDAGTVVVDERPLPGVYVDIEVSGAIKQESVSRGGQSGNARLLRGWDDTRIRLRLMLRSDDGGQYPTADIRALRELFRADDGNGKPVLYRISHPLIDAFIVRDVLFLELRIVDRSGDGATIAELEFSEYTPPPPGAAFIRKLREYALKGIVGTGVAAGQAAGAVTTAGVSLAAAATKAKSWVAKGGIEKAAYDFVERAEQARLARGEVLYPTPPAAGSLEVDGDSP